MQPTSKEDWSAKKSVASYDRNFENSFWHIYCKCVAIFCCGTAVRSKVRYADKQFNKLLRKKYSVVSEVLEAPLWAGDIPAFPRFICACKIRREKNLEKTPRSVVFVPGPFSSYQIWSRGEKPTCGSAHKDFSLKNPGHLLHLFCAKKTRLWHFLRENEKSRAVDGMLRYCNTSAIFILNTVIVTRFFLSGVVHTLLSCKNVSSSQSASPKKHLPLPPQKGRPLSPTRSYGYNQSMPSFLLSSSIGYRSNEGEKERRQQMT